MARGLHLRDDVSGCVVGIVLLGTYEEEMEEEVRLGSEIERAIIRLD